jgi:hypothetical protein
MSFGLGWLLEYFAYNFGASRSYMTQAVETAMTDFREDYRLAKMLKNPPAWGQDLLDWETRTVFPALERRLGVERDSRGNMTRLPGEGDIPDFAVDQKDAAQMWGSAFSDRNRLALYLDYLTMISVEGDRHAALRDAIDLQIRAWRPDSAPEWEDYEMTKLNQIPWLWEFQQMTPYKRAEILRRVWNDPHASRRALLRDGMDEDQMAFINAVDDLSGMTGPRRWSFWGRGGWFFGLGRLLGHGFRSWEHDFWPNLPVDERRVKIWEVLVRHGLADGPLVDESNPYFAHISKLLGLPSAGDIVERMQYLTCTGLGQIAAELSREDRGKSTGDKKIATPEKRVMGLMQMLPHLSGADSMLNQKFVQNGILPDGAAEWDRFRRAVAAVKIIYINLTGKNNSDAYAELPRIQALETVLTLTEKQKLKLMKMKHRAWSNAFAKVQRIAKPFDSGWQRELFDLLAEKPSAIDDLERDIEKQKNIVAGGVERARPKKAASPAAPQPTARPEIRRSEMAERETEGRQMIAAVESADRMRFEIRKREINHRLADAADRLNLNLERELDGFTQNHALLEALGLAPVAVRPEDETGEILIAYGELPQESHEARMEFLKRIAERKPDAKVKVKVFAGPADVLQMREIKGEALGETFEAVSHQSLTAYLEEKYKERQPAERFLQIRGDVLVDPRYVEAAYLGALEYAANSFVILGQTPVLPEARIRTVFALIRTLLAEAAGQRSFAASA